MAENAAEVAQALERWLETHGTSATVLPRGRATVGLSQETWFVDVRTPDRTVEAVLRRPTASSGARALATQVTAIRGLDGTAVPAPQILWSDNTEEHPLGRPFFVMERVAGAVPVGWHDLQPEEQQGYAEQAIDILAELHAVPVDRLGPRPSATFDLAWYERRFDKLGGAPPVLQAALWWMHRYRPDPPAERVIVHGDFRMGNFVLNEGRVAGILDWEMTAVGHPVEDLAWCTLPVWDPPSVDEDSLIARYEERTQRAVSREDYRWYRALGYLRCVYYAMSGTKAFDTGVSSDLRLAALRLRVPVQLDRLLALLSGERSS